MTLRNVLTAFGIGLALASAAAPGDVEAQESSAKRLRVLITNDNGIDDPKLLALARAFSRQADTWVVAPDRDQSGTGTRLTFMTTGKLVAERREIGEGIEAFAVNGTPGDCVVLAGTALMADNPPDLVVSGINGGPNLGMEWMYSGTVGAARVAALGGVPAIAVSGLDDDLPGAVDAAVSWVVRLSRSEVVKDLRPGEYLTASLPRIAPGEIRGIKIVDRAPGFPMPRFALTEDSTWQLVGMDASEVASPPNSDRAVYEEGFIAVVLMCVDEVDSERLVKLQRGNVQLPQWREGVPEQR